MSNPISRPSHYTSGKTECRHIIEQATNAEGFYVGCAIKYLYRFRHNGTPIEDLRKAQQYIDFLIEFIEAEEAAPADPDNLQARYDELIKNFDEAIRQRNSYIKQIKDEQLDAKKGRTA